MEPLAKQKSSTLSAQHVCEIACQFNKNNAGVFVNADVLFSSLTVVVETRLVANKL